MNASIGYRIIVLWAIGGLLAQFIKFAMSYFKEKRVNLRHLIEPGGMPSSHSSAAAALSTAIGLAFGFDSGIFAATLFFSFVIIYEATGLRRVVGEQAEVLNELIEALRRKERLHSKKLHVLLGHTPVEVLMGVLMGVFVTLAFFT
jgi:acid phosphatase family membrane protein YuiD